MEKGSKGRKEDKIVHKEASPLPFYKPISFLGLGGFGIVFLVKPSDSDTNMALKFVCPQEEELNIIIERECEAMEATENQHQNVMTVLRHHVVKGSFAHDLIDGWIQENTSFMPKLPRFDLVIFHGLLKQFTMEGRNVLCIEMEACGPTLRKWFLANSSPSTEDDSMSSICIRISCELVRGLDFLHSRNITHRDLKPENIFFSYGEQDDDFKFPIKIGDFGQAKETAVTHSLTCSHSQSFSAIYRAKEARFSEEPGKKLRYGKNADWYSVGLILYEIFYCVPLRQLEVSFESLVFDKRFLNPPRSQMEAIQFEEIKEAIVGLTRRNSVDRQDTMDAILEAFSIADFAHVFQQAYANVEKATEVWQTIKDNGRLEISERDQDIATHSGVGASVEFIPRKYADKMIVEYLPRPAAMLLSQENHMTPAAFPPPPPPLTSHSSSLQPLEQENNFSPLLSSDEKKVIFNTLGWQEQALATAVVTLRLDALFNRSDEIKAQEEEKGVTCFVRNVLEKSCFILIFLLPTGRMVLRKEIDNDFEYKMPGERFLTFEHNNRTVRMDFAHPTEAVFFREVLNSKLETMRHRQLSSDNGRKEDKQGGRKYYALRKEDIGEPTNFQHIQHVSWDPVKGFTLNGVDDDLKEFFSKAGVSSHTLKDENKRQFIYQFINEHGGLDKIKRVASSRPVAPSSPSLSVSAAEHPEQMVVFGHNRASAPPTTPSPPPRLFPAPPEPHYRSSVRRSATVTSDTAITHVRLSALQNRPKDRPPSPPLTHGIGGSNQTEASVPLRPPIPKPRGKIAAVPHQPVADESQEQ